MTNQPTPVILSDEQIAEIEAHWISGASTEEEDDENIGALIQTVRALRAERDALAAWKAKMLVRCEEVDTILDNSAADHTRLTAENTALREQLAQVATKPVGWISCGLRQGRDDRIVDIVFENAECAKAFIDGVEPTVGPIVAATRMRERCAEKVRALSIRSEKYPDRYITAAAFKTRVECALESLTLDGEKEQ